jgi:hypothetical protein
VSLRISPPCIEQLVEQPLSVTHTMAKLKESTLWANRKCLLICSAVAIASMQYGIDTAAVGGLQAMPGFLMVFGYEDQKSPLGYGIDVCIFRLGFDCS